MAFTEQTSAQDRQTKQSGFRIRRLRVSRVSIALAGQGFWHFPQETQTDSSTAMPFLANREEKLRIVP